MNIEVDPGDILYVYLEHSAMAEDPQKPGEPKSRVTLKPGDVLTCIEGNHLTFYARFMCWRHNVKVLYVRSKILNFSLLKRLNDDTH